MTHLFDLADSQQRPPSNPTLFLRAERLPDGHWTFKLIVCAPLSTSYEADMYARVFGHGSGVIVAREISAGGDRPSAQRQGKDHDE